VSYEELCISPLEGFKDLYTWIGLDWSDEIQEEIASYVYPNPNQLDTSILGVRKSSIERATAWRTELPPWQIGQARRILEQTGTADFSIDSLTTEEYFRGLTNYIKESPGRLRYYLYRQKQGRLGR
jgi:hypothetical protein